MIELGKLFIPTLLDYKSTEGTITFRTPEFLSEDYINDSACNLQLDINGTHIHIDYYCEDDAFLSDLLELEAGCIAQGDLSIESFQKIQDRALKVLVEFIDESQQELVEHFDKI